MAAHGVVKLTESLTVTPLDALSDNYMYLIADEATKEAAVIDPVDASTCVAAAEARGLALKMVLTTHHHFDHAGGNGDMKKSIPSIEVVGGEDVQAMTKRVADGQVLTLGRLSITCVHTPAHTNGHMSYLLSDSQAASSAAGAVFTGDALFVGGCGRFFEGGPEQMLAAAAKLSALPASTLVFCGHEYTIKNLQFALEVEPQNEAVQQKGLWAEGQRAAGKPTVPSTLGDELSYNPFLRCSQPAVRAYVGCPDGSEVDVMRKLRSAKDKFAGTTRPWIPGGGPLPGL